MQKTTTPKDDSIVMVSFKLERATVDALEAIAARLATENFAGRPNKTAAIRYLIDLDRQNEAAKKSKKSPK